MKKLFNIIYDSESFQMHFDVSVDVAVNRLNSRVRRLGFFRISGPIMVGTVTSDAVKIRRLNNIYNTFRPVLDGQLAGNKQGSVLTGVFRPNRLTQIFMRVWLLVALMSAVAFMIIGIGEAEDMGSYFFAGLFSSFAGLLLIVVGIGVVKLGEWIYCDDKDWLKKEIVHSINCDS